MPDEKLDMSDLLIGARLARECKKAPRIKFDIDAVSALKMVGLLQLALRHPGMDEGFPAFVHELAAQLRVIGPTFARVVDMGFDPNQDRPRRSH